MSDDQKTIESAGATVVPLVKYEITLDQVREMVAQYDALTSADTPELYEACRKGRAHLRGTRTGVEKRRVSLKAGALEYGRAVDRVAKELTSAIEPTEERLDALIKAIDDEKERVKREAAEAERQKVADALRKEQEEAEARRRAAIEEEERQAREAREAEDRRLAARRAEIEAEEARQAAERARIQAEREEAEAKLAEERKAAEAHVRALQAEADRKERERREAIAAEERARAVEREREQAELQAQRDELARRQAAAEKEEAVRLAKAQAEEEARARAEREKVEAEERRIEALERAKRLEALRPEAEKLAAFAAVIRALEIPEVTSEEAREAVRGCARCLGQAREYLEDFVDETKATTTGSEVAA